jgi:hypothetical protein
MSWEELDITSVFEDELTLPVPIDVATLLMDPNIPEVVDIVIVEEYDM